MVRQFPNPDNVALIMKTDKDNPKGISRRDALKRMGLFVAGAAALSMPTALTSCDNEKKKRIILYFTATGNSLYIARQLADEETELLSIPQIVKQGRHDFEADEIGIVYPIYGHMPPNMVRNFIKQARIKAGYKFAVLTYGMLDFNAAELWDGISQQAGTKFDYINTLVMVDNWLPNFDMAEQMKMDKHIPEQLEKIGRLGATYAVGEACHRRSPPRPRRLCRLFAPRPGGWLPDAEREVFPSDGCLHRLWRMHRSLSARQLRTDFHGSKDRGRLRLLFRLHPQLPAESHTVPVFARRPVACTRRGEP